MSKILSQNWKWRENYLKWKERHFGLCITYILGIEHIGFAIKNRTCTKRAITTALTDPTIHILKSNDHDHPPCHEEVEAVRRCVQLKRSAASEPLVALSQIIQRELERVPSGVLTYLLIQESLKRNINKRSQCILPRSFSHA